MPESERDAEAILEWLYSQQAGDTGIRWFQALETISPARCPLAPENADFPYKARRLLYLPYADSSNSASGVGSTS